MYARGDIRRSTMFRSSCLALTVSLSAPGAAAWLRAGNSALARDAPNPVLGTFESLHTMMCWSKDSIMEHEKCMLFMVEACRDKSTGHGKCQELEGMLKTTCETPGDDSKAACSYAKKMGLDIVGTADPEWWKKTVSMKADPDPEKALQQLQFRESQIVEPQPAPPEPEQQDMLELQGSGDGGGGGGGAPKGLSEPSGAAPAPAPMADPAAAPSPSAMFAPGPSLATDENATVTLPPHTQVIMDMVVPEEGLPEQGFTGHSSRLADHEDGETHTSDWGKEWPQVAESEGKTKERVCLQYPKTCAVPGCTSAQSF
mmetsp:Transcript_107012/g.345468  ORF Transcript_107012/g.345468 Transcript_107012/m.345468 type:complete len:314 (-) Transcript_107012:191-1132(-)